MNLIEYKNAESIMDYIQFNSNEAAVINKICDYYPMLVNHYYLSLINPNVPNDPIRKMSIPSAAELQKGGNEDTSGEYINTVFEGVQHKYKQTLLVLSTDECFMYCRHCFRKRIIGNKQLDTTSQIENILNYLSNKAEINNILISGGDSFFNSNEIIENYLNSFAFLKQLDFIRFGTRTPVAFPQRIYKDARLLELLGEYNKIKQIYIITQFNHPTEITSEAELAIKSLTERGIIVKNQSVLLNGINDKPHVLANLLSNLTSIGVIPYYIFQCRPVRGVLNHFQVPLLRGNQIVSEALSRQNGQGKCVKFIMSHYSGKIEIIGTTPQEEMIFKYHQAKDAYNSNKVFKQRITTEQCWI